MPTQHQSNAIMPRTPLKLAAFTALALCCAAPAYSQSPETGNCFRVTTEQEQQAGASSIAPADSCSAENGDICFRQKGPISPRPDSIKRSFVPVDSCTKYDLFDEEEKP